MMTRRERRDIITELAVLLIDEYNNYFDPMDPEKKPDGYKLSLIFKLMNEEDKQDALEYLLRRQK